MEEREETITLYGARAAGKLRIQSSVTGDIQVTIRTNPFKPIEPQYSHVLIIPLSEATDDTLKLTQATIFGLYFKIDELRVQKTTN